MMRLVLFLRFLKFALDSSVTMPNKVVVFHVATDSFDHVLGILSGQGTAALAGLTADTWYNSALLSNSADIEVITWERLAEAAQSSPTYKSLHSLITSGAPENKDMWPADLQIY